MSAEGPPLDRLTRRLAETPAVFLDEPRIRKRGQVDLAAVACDLLLAVGGTLPSPRQAGSLRPGGLVERNRARLALVCCWLLYDDWFHGRAALGDPIHALLSEGLRELADLVDASHFVADAERREELVRLVLQHIGLRPAGESAHQAADRLRSLDSLERERLIREAQAREEAERARKLQAKMAEKKAREAAAKASREW